MSFKSPYLSTSCHSNRNMGVSGQEYRVPFEKQNFLGQLYNKWAVQYMKGNTTITTLFLGMALSSDILIFIFAKSLLNSTQ